MSTYKLWWELTQSQCIPTEGIQWNKYFVCIQTYRSPRNRFGPNPNKKGWHNTKPGRHPRVPDSNMFATYLGTGQNLYPHIKQLVMSIILSFSLSLSLSLYTKVLIEQTQVSRKEERGPTNFGQIHAHRGSWTELAGWNPKCQKKLGSEQVSAPSKTPRFGFALGHGIRPLAADQVFRLLAFQTNWRQLAWPVWQDTASCAVTGMHT